MPQVGYSTFIPQTPDGTDFYVARLQVGAKTTTLSINGDANTQDTAAVTYPGRARVSGNKRRVGLRAAHATLRAQNPAPPGYTANSYVRVALLNPTIQRTCYDEVRTPTAEPTLSYAGSALWDLISYTPEYLDGIPPF